MGFFNNLEAKGREENDPEVFSPVKLYKLATGCLHLEPNICVLQQKKPMHLKSLPAYLVAG